MDAIGKFLSNKKFIIIFAVVAILLDCASSLFVPHDLHLVDDDVTEAFLAKQLYQAAAVLFLALVDSVMLLFCRRLIPVMATGLITILVSCRCYDSFHIFLGEPLVYFTVPICAFFIFALIFNFVRFYKQYGFNIKVGPTMRGIIAVTAAVSLGGIGVISFSDYISAGYYIFFLGLGMLGIYLVLTSRIAPYRANRIIYEMAFILSIVGIVAAIMAIKSFVVSLDSIIDTHTVPDWKFRNNFSTIMMICLPMPLMFSKKYRWSVLISIGIFISMLLLGSRGGTFMGGAELTCCLVFMAISDRENRWIYLVALAACGIAVLCLWNTLIEYFSERFWNLPVERGEQRWELAKRSIEDFSKAPLFGQGLGYKGNVDIYEPKSGAIVWYHTMIPQVIGSMGFLGIAAYVYQFFNRFMTTVRNSCFEAWIMYLGYLGLFLMSQCNPGEFCPFPYEFIAVLIFVLIENIEVSPELKKLHPLHHLNFESAGRLLDS